jgi:hypothetical protein
MIFFSCAATTEQIANAITTDTAPSLIFIVMLFSSSANVEHAAGLRGRSFVVPSKDRPAVQN